MKPINVAVVGTGWIGGLRASTSSRYPHTSNLYLCDIDQARVQEVASQTEATAWSLDHRDLLKRDVDAVIISTAPETTHFPIAREWLKAGRHVLLEKPMALSLAEADELIALARENNVKLAIGYSQRFNPKFAYVKEAVSEGKLGKPVTALISRHITRAIGAKIAGRGKLGPVEMEGTHDIDLVLWWMAPALPKRVYAQAADGVMRQPYNLPDCVWTLVTLDSGATFTIGSNWNLPVESPGLSATTIEFVGTDGAVFVDDSHRDVLETTVAGGVTRPMGTMPGQQVGHLWQGPMETETRAFLDNISRDEPILVTAEQARVVMEVTLAAELSARIGQPVDLPLPKDAPVRDLVSSSRAG